jgi:hypothetical protein
MSYVILMLHATIGMLFVLAAVWLYVDVLNVNAGNLGRIRLLSQLSALMMWLTYVLGGYWYVVYYYKDKEAILKGPWPFSHNFFMETKEHVLLMLVLLATLLPVLASNDLLGSKTARKAILCITALIILGGLFMEGAGAFISMGAKIALTPQ